MYKNVHYGPSVTGQCFVKKQSNNLHSRPPSYILFTQLSCREEHTKRLIPGISFFVFNLFHIWFTQLRETHKFDHFTWQLTADLKNMERYVWVETEIYRAKEREIWEAMNSKQQIQLDRVLLWWRSSAALHSQTSAASVAMDPDS